MKLKAAWIAFLCWFLEHRMVVVAEIVDWGIRDTKSRCSRCGGNETYERYINTK